MAGLWHHLCIKRSALKTGSPSEEPSELEELGEASLNPPSRIAPGRIMHLNS